MQRTLPKVGVWLPMLLAMHAQTTFNQGLLQVPHSLPLPSLLTLKDETATSALCCNKKRLINIKCNGRII